MSSGCVIRYEGARGVVWRIKFADAAGKQTMETVGREADGWTEVKAQRELGKRLAAVEKGWRKPPALTFAVYADTWFGEGEVRRGWAPSTVREYRSVRRRLIGGFGRMPLAAVRPRDVAAYVTALSETHGAAVVARDVAVLHSLFKTARTEELVQDNPAEGVERPRLPRRRWRILEPDEVVAVGAAFTESRLRAVFLTLVQTGLRRHELENLRWADVDMLEGVLRVRRSKTAAGERAISVPPRLRAELEAHFAASAYRAETDYVFAHPQRGTPLDAATFAHAFRVALATVGITDHVRPFHDLRHSSLTHGALAGEGPIELMARAGHTNMSTTKRYLDLAGRTFPDRAAALEVRLLGAQLSTESSTDLTSPESISEHPASLNQAPQA